MNPKALWFDVTEEGSGESRHEVVFELGSIARISINAMPTSPLPYL